MNVVRGKPRARSALLTGFLMYSSIKIESMNNAYPKFLTEVSKLEDQKYKSTCTYLIEA